MSFFNKIILIGRLVRDPEKRYTLSGTPVTTFTIAVDRVPRKNAPDDAQTTDFFRIVTFGRLAEFARTYLTKGRLVLVEGEMRMRRWETPSGEKRVSPEVVANVVRFMDRKPAETVNETEEELEIPEEDFSSDTFSEDEPPF